MYHAYLGTADYHGETEADSLAEVRRTFAGHYGPFNWSASRVIDCDNALISAALVTRFENTPMLAFLMTRPEFKRRGFARACLTAATNQLLQQGDHELHLAVTMANIEAVNLYRQFGFAGIG